MYSFKFIDTEPNIPKPFRGLITINEKEVPFFIEGVFDLWFNIDTLMECVELVDDNENFLRREFQGCHYTDVPGLLYLFPKDIFMLLKDIKNKWFYIIADHMKIQLDARKRERTLL